MQRANEKGQYPDVSGSEQFRTAELHVTLAYTLLCTQIENYILFTRLIGDSGIRILGTQTRRFPTTGLEATMPEANTATYLRDNAANFRRLAKEQNESGHYPIFAKLTEVASDLEAEAADLDSKNASNLI
jgi:hypothetical protein